MAKRYSKSFLMKFGDLLNKNTMAKPKGKPFFKVWCFTQLKALWLNDFASHF
jgi:hypothetical protein